MLVYGNISIYFFYWFPIFETSATACAVINPIGPFEAPHS